MEPTYDVAFIQHMLLTLLLGAPRLMMVFMVLPIIGTNLVSGLVRTGIVLSFVVFLYPAISPAVAAAAPSGPVVIAIIFKEALIGGLLGFAIGAIFWGIQGAGFFIDNHRGAAIAGSADPLSGVESSPLGIAFSVAYTTWIFVSGGFLALLGTLYHSYVIWPVLQFYPQLPPEIVPFMLGLGDQVMYLSLVLAGPVVIAMFLAEFGLALVSRFAPQLNVFILAMPVKSGIAMFMLVLYIPFLFRYLRDTIQGGDFGVVNTLIGILR